MTELQAINLMLSGIGELPALTIYDPIPDIDHAKSILDSVVAEVQNTAWHFNTEPTELKPDIKGEVYIPPDAHRVISNDPYCSYIKRGDRLYDAERRTFAIGKNVLVKVIRIVPFAQIPATFQHYIALRAARKFQNNVLGADSIRKYQEQDEAEAKLACMKEEQAITKPNIKGNRILNGWSVAKTLRR